MHTQIHLELNAIGYTLTNGTKLFNHISASFNRGLHGLVGKNGIGKSTLLKIIAGCISPSDGTVIKPLKTSFLQQELHQSHQTLADIFGVAKDIETIQRIEKGAISDDDLDNVDWIAPQKLETMLQKAGLQHHDGTTSIRSLSGGEAMRAFLIALFHGGYDLILLDEPTNNLDTQSRQLLIQQLKAYQGIALIASHDRTLLMEMDTINELTPHDLIRSGGNYAHYSQEQKQRLALAEQAVHKAAQQNRKTALENQKIKERQDKRNRQGKQARNKNDMPKISLDRAKNNAENSSGRLNEKLNMAAIAADQMLQEAQQKLAIQTPLSVKLASTGLANGKHVIEATHLNGGANGIIKDFNLSLYGPEHIAITGKNGSGKTTLLNLLTGRLKATSGRAEVYVHTAMLDQHVGLLDPDKTLLENFNSLNPHANTNDCHAALARLGFRNEAAHKKIHTLSGGEKLRAALACTIGAEQPPQLLILDEPTNHLDLDAIAALEAGLNAYDGALLVVSHDEAFLDAIKIDRTITL